MSMKSHESMAGGSVGVVRQCGLSLIEVLVAVLVIAVGLLGLAGLQAGALQSNRVAYERTQASLLAYDIVERMRANRDAAIAGDYDNTLSETTASGGAAPVPADVAQWNDLVADQMAGGQGGVASGAAAGCPACVEVTIRWERREDAGETTYRYQTRL